MKPYRTYSNRLGKLAALATVFILGVAALTARADYQWNGANGAGNMTYANNWYNSSLPYNFGFGQSLLFNYNNGNETGIYNDFGSWYNVDDIKWASTFSAPSSAITWNSAGQGFDFNQRLENDWSGQVTINCPTSGNKNSAGHIELNPVNGDMILLASVYNDNNSSFQVWGGNSKMLTIGVGLTGNSTVSLTIEQYSKVKLTAAQSWGDSTHGVNINQGEFWMDSGGSLASTSVPITVGLSDGNTAKLWLSVLSGGQTLNNPITVNNQATAGEKDVGGLNTSGTSTFSGTLALNGQVNLSAATGGTVTFGGVISGSSQNVVVNGYQLPFSGIIIMSAANTYNGNTYISGGTLQFNSGGSAASSPNFYLGETSGSETATLALGVAGGGQTLNNPITVRSGSSGTKTISGLATSSSSTLGGAITLNDNLTVSSATGGNLNLNGIISQSSGTYSLTKVGSGTLTLQGANTYSGGTTIKAGQVTISGTSSGTTGPLGPNTANVYLGDTTGTASATLAYSGVSTTHAYPITVQSGSTGTKMLANLSSVALVYSGGVVLNDSLTLDPGGATGSINLSGPVTGTGGINKVDTSTATLSASSSANTYSGTTTITQGSLQPGSGTAIPSGGGKGIVTLNPAASTTATFDLNGNNQTINGLTSSGAGSAVVDDTSSTSVTLTVGTTGSNPSGTFSGVLQNSSTGKLGLTKAGSGTLTLSGANTYSGNTTVSGGTLALSGSGSMANSPSITVASGAILDVTAVTGGYAVGGTQSLQGIGTVNGAVTVNGTLSPGNGVTIGTLAFGNSLTLGGASTTSMAVNKASGPVYTADKAAVTGAVTYGGTLNVTATGSTLAAGDTFTLFSGSGFSGWFGTVSVPALASGISWDTNKLATTGVLDIYNFTTTALALTTPTNTAATITSAKLANHASSGRGTPVATTATSPSHGTATVTSGALTYTPASNFSGSDSFTVTFQDSHGWQTMAVSVTVGNGTGQSPNYLSSGTTNISSVNYFYVNFAGIPGDTYTVETNSVANGAGWTKWGNITASATGAMQVLDPVGSGSLFYRTVYPAY